MKKRSFLIYMLLTITLILGACGTSNDEGKKSSGADNDKDNHMEENIDETDPEEKDDDGEENDDSSNVEDDEEKEDNKSNLPSNENDTDDDSKEEYLAKAEVQNSDEQDFSMAVLPNYTLTSEEPGKDSLYLTEDGAIFMRIETVPFDQEGYDFFKGNTLEMLEGMAADGEEVQEITDPNSLASAEGIEDQIGYTVKTDDIYMSSIVFKQEEMLVRLTIFDSADQTYFQDLIQMGETIISQ